MTLSWGLMGTAAAEEPTDDLTPRGTYVEVELDPSRVLTSDDGPLAGGGPRILFLNRCAGGVTINPGGGGSVANQSSILGGPVNFPPFPYGDGAWNQVMDHARSIFSPFNISVVDVDPGNTPHDEAIVCGTGSGAGFSGAGGVAPFTCGIITNPITFTFAETIGNNPRVLAEVVGQEAAHAWGLDHEFLCEDPMTYLNGCGQKTFQNIDAQCGEFNPRACSCGGSTQNSYEYILNAFGSAIPDTQSPTAAITSPSDGDVFTPGSSFDISVSVNDDVQVALVTLYADGAVAGSDDSTPFGPWPVTNIPEGTYEFYIEAEDTSGNVTVSPVVTIDVTADGEPPPPGDGDGGDGDGGDGGGTAGDGGADSGGGDGDGGDAGDGGGDGDGGDAGALPDGYGSGFDPNSSAAGCDCRSAGTPQGGLGFGLLLLGLLGLRRRRVG
ncbi:MAG: Ig-like domain-containing protein [Nannocystaceae bacterium]